MTTADAKFGTDRLSARGVELLVTTCEGREHLLRRTMVSLEQATDFRFDRRLVAVDGQIAREVLDSARPDVVVQSWQRRGYIASILNALAQIRGEYFFWLEDDWSFEVPLDVARMLRQIDAHPDWMQMRLSKVAPLPAEEQTPPIDDEVKRSGFGFSANPCLCRTAHVRRAFKALVEAPRDPLLSFENFISEWAESAGLTCAVIDPGETLPIAHLGYLESTPRQFHMTMSLEEGRKLDHLFSLGEYPPLWRRALLAVRLARTAAAIGWRQFRDLEAYELAFRIVAQASRLGRRS